MPNPTALRIEYVPLDEILDADRNAKEHDVPAIARSIVQFGFADPVLIDERTGRLIGGHGRLKGLRRLRDDNKTAPEGIVPTTEGGWLVPVTRGWRSISDEHADAANLALNRVHDLGGYNDRALAEILDDLFDTAPDYAEAAGYDQGYLDKLIASFSDDGDKGDDDGDDDEKGPAEGFLPDEDPEDKYREQYGVIVICSNEEEQQSAYEELKGSGYNVRVVTT